VDFQETQGREDTRLMASFSSPSLINQNGPSNLDFNEATDDLVAAASAGPYSNHLHLAPDWQPRQHLITQVLQAGSSSRRPTNSDKALKAIQNSTGVLQFEIGLFADPNNHIRFTALPGPPR